MIVLKGLRILSTEKSNNKFVVIESFSDEFKKYISDELISICYGNSDDLELFDSYSYKNTVTEFIVRYESKSDIQKIGYIGELLSQLLMRIINPELTPLSAFFNIEERNVKKGFDQVFYDSVINENWYIEVKSGLKGDKITVEDKISSLVNSCVRDLKEKLSNQQNNVWNNAISHARFVIDKNNKLKEAIFDVLDNDAIHSKNVSDYRVYLSTILFHNHFESTSNLFIEELIKKIKDKNIFKDTNFLLIQKSTYIDIYNYIKSEVKTYD